MVVIVLIQSALVSRRLHTREPRSGFGGEQYTRKHSQAGLE